MNGHEAVRGVWQTQLKPAESGEDLCILLGLRRISQAWLLTQHLFPALQLPRDRSGWSQGLAGVSSKMALLRVGLVVGSKMTPDGSRGYRPLGLSQGGCSEVVKRVSICSWLL